MNRHIDPPEWIDSIIDSIAPGEFAEEIKGDLYELFLKDIGERDIRVAKRNYVLRGFGFLAKRFLWRKSNENNNSFNMITSYFKMARRSLMAYKGNAIINISGLVTGIAAALVIFNVVHFEKSFDAYHTYADRTYRMVRVSGDNMDEFRTGISYPVPGAMKDEIPSLKHIVSLEYFGAGNVDVLNTSGTSEKMFLEGSGLVLAEQSFFTIFDYKGSSFKWLAGNPEKALTEPNSVVLTRSMAKKYFGDESPLDRTLRFQKQIDCKVTGVVEDLPPNTDFPFTVLVSYNTIHKNERSEMDDWTSVSDDHHTYIVLEPGTTKKEMEKLIAGVHAAHTPKEIYQSRHYLLQPLSQMHVDARFGNFSGRTISSETILALSLIAIFLLLTASINYINLATAQSTLRAKEIGLRKVMGSNRKGLMFQFLTETFIIVIVAGVIAMAVAEGILYYFEDLLNMRWTGFHFTEPFMMLSISGIVIAVTLFSGFYPALMISRFNPIKSLRNKFSTENVGGFSLRKVLVIVQFTITQILVVGTFIVVSQMRFFNDRDMGFNKDAIITVPVPDNNPSKLDVLAQQLRAQAVVSDISFSFSLPSGVNRNRSYQDMKKRANAPREEIVIFEYASVDSAFLALYKINLIAGRNLTAQDSVGNILINRTMVKRLQLGSPEESVGVTLNMRGREVVVAGVIEDYFSNSLKYGVDAIGMTVDPGSYRVVSIKLNAKNGDRAMTEAIAGIEKAWKTTYPDYVFAYQFFDENIKAFYVQEAKYASLFQLFSITFLLIGSLGLYGLITFMVNRKGKEVAIRKVLGASIPQILVMFSKEYVQMILISFLLALPVAWYAVNSWLSNFAEQVPLSWWLFIIPGSAVLALALVVVVIKSLRTANANPVDSLKYE